MLFFNFISRCSPNYKRLGYAALDEHIDGLKHHQMLKMALEVAESLKPMHKQTEKKTHTTDRQRDRKF